jgi:putative heme transporter
VEVLREEPGGEDVVAAPMDDDASVKRRAIGVSVAVAVVVGVFVFVLPKIADYGAVWDTIRGLTWEQIGALAVAVAINIATFAPPFMATLPGLGFLRALVVTQASTASTYIAPGGAAVGMGISYAMLRSWGFEPAAVALAVTLTGVWNQMFMLGAPAVALALLTVQGGSNPLLQTVALIGLVIFVVAVAAFAAALSGDGLAQSVGDLAARLASWGLRRIKRRPVTWGGATLVVFRRRAIGLLRRRWWALTLATAAGQLSVFAVLVVCLRTLGITAGQVTLTEAFAAWTLVRLLGSLPITPGGIGIVELGLTGALVGFGGANDRVVAAVLLYRVLTVVPTLVLGLVAGALFRRLRPHDTAAAISRYEEARRERA